MTSVITRATLSSGNAGLRPLPGLSSRPDNPDRSKRDDQTDTVRGEALSRTATSFTATRSRRCRMIPARNRSRCAMARPFARRLSSAFTSSPAESTLTGRAMFRFRVRYLPSSEEGAKPLPAKERWNADLRRRTSNAKWLAPTDRQSDPDGDNPQAAPLRQRAIMPRRCARRRRVGCAGAGDSVGGIDTK